MKVRCHVLSVITLISMTAIAAPTPFKQDRCHGGGDGPQPMIDATNTFPSYVQPLATNGELSEYVLWQKHQELVYRNQKGAIESIKTNGQVGSPLSTSSQRLSRIVDGEERFLLTQGSNWLFDTVGSSWTQYDSPDQFTPAFWHAQRLVGVGQASALIGGRQYRLYEVDPSDGSTQRICRFTYFPVRDGYQLAQGSSYPKVIFYRQVRTNDGTSLTVSRVNVENCTVDDFTYKTFSGTVKNIYWFGAMSSTLIEIDRPTQQLMWDTGPDDEHCHTYGVGKATVMVPGFGHPLIAAYTPESGITLVYLHDPQNHPGKTANILSEFKLDGLEASDLSLSDDARTLFASPKFGASKRFVLKVDLPPLPY